MSGDVAAIPPCGATISTNYMDYSFITPYIRYWTEDKHRQAWELTNRTIGDIPTLYCE